MPAFYVILKEPALLVSRYTGCLTSGDVLDTLTRYLDDPRYDPAHSHLVDLRQATEFDIDFGRMMRLATRLEPFYTRRAPGARSAILAPQDVAFGVARMYQSLVGERMQNEVGVFRQPEAAAAFLGIAPDSAALHWDSCDDDPSRFRAAGPLSP